MSSYAAIFYKPGKKSFSGKEISGLIEKIHSGKGKAYSLFPDDPHFTNDRKFIIKEVETELDLSLFVNVAEIKGIPFSFHLYPAQEEIHGSIATLSIPEDVFESHVRESTSGLISLASVIMRELSPDFGWADHELELTRLEPWLIFERVKALAWLNLFPQRLVQKLGGLGKFPATAEEKQLSNEYGFLPFLTAENPTLPIDGEFALSLTQYFPDAMLRSFEMVIKSPERKQGSFLERLLG